MNLLVAWASTLFGMLVVARTLLQDIRLRLGFELRRELSNPSLDLARIDGGEAQRQSLAGPRSTAVSAERRHGTSWRSDPEKGMVAILMTQRLGFPLATEVYRDFWTEVDKALSD